MLRTHRIGKQCITGRMPISLSEIPYLASSLTFFSLAISARHFQYLFMLFMRTFPHCRTTYKALYTFPLSSSPVVLFKILTCVWGRVRAARNKRARGDGKDKGESPLCCFPSPLSLHYHARLPTRETTGIESVFTYSEHKLQATNITKLRKAHFEKTLESKRGKSLF